ncbi:hypothetical protein SETIT_9G230900v2 [Setaria italica]|uniref:Uncharacterized protein n=2 Tax=Setaria TaxID=4554 RepID=K4AHU7_SETIT|nr:hypothetical protein SETIT_9G230900v2 [Setaria italica]TKV93512.1 hypothetical protein SEVIR_9G230400v2 [Setaria viridis]
MRPSPRALCELGSRSMARRGGGDRYRQRQCWGALQEDAGDAEEGGGGDGAIRRSGEVIT